MGHPRLDGEEYYSFVDEWVTAVHSRWPSKFSYFILFFFTCLLTINSDALIQFEDFKYPHAYNLLNKCKYINYGYDKNKKVLMLFSFKNRSR